MAPPPDAGDDPGAPGEAGAACAEVVMPA